MSKELLINPKTKIGDLLDRYPELEDVLIDLVPTFKKLRNPVLRKTIARMTSLQQASVVGGIDLNKLINKLRQSVGQEERIDMHPTDIEQKEQPDWFDKNKIIETYDARQDLANGIHPVEIVLKTVNKMNTGDIYELITPFLPAPLIDKAVGMGCKSWTIKKDSAFHNFLLKD